MHVILLALYHNLVWKYADMTYFLSKIYTDLDVLCHNLFMRNNWVTSKSGWSTFSMLQHISQFCPKWYVTDLFFLETLLNTLCMTKISQYASKFSICVPNNMVVSDISFLFLTILSVSAYYQMTFDICWVALELAHPGHEWSVSCINKSQSTQKICWHFSHMYTYNGTIYNKVKRQYFLRRKICVHVTQESAPSA